MIEKVIETTLAIFIFSLIPLLVYIIKYKTVKGFLSYIGLKKSNRKANYFAALTSLLLFAPLLLLTMTNTDFRDIMFDPLSNSGKFRLMDLGIYSGFVLILAAVFNTALAEEIFFRGFIAKRLIHVMGYKAGNMVQAIIFGLVHAVVFLSITNNYMFLLLIFLVPFTVAYLMTFLNEKLANGSIIPGWITHGLANLLSFGIIGFVL